MAILLNVDFAGPEKIASLEQSLVAYPNDLKPRLELIEIYLNQENYPEAKKHLEIAAKLDSSSAKLSYLWGKFYDQQDNIALAQTRYLEALARDSSLSAAWRALGYIHEITNQYAKMLDCFNKALRNSDDSAGQYYDIGVTYDYLDSTAQAMVSYHLAMAKGAAFADVFTNLGVDFGYMGESDSALSYFQKASMAGSRSPELYYNMAMLSIDKGLTQQALVSLTRSLSCDPDFSPAKLQLGNVFESLGDSTQAEAYFSEFVQTAPIIYYDDINKTREKLAAYHKSK